MFVQQPRYIMIKNAISNRNKHNSPQNLNKSVYQDERKQLKNLIQKSLENPNHMEEYLTQFLSQKSDAVSVTNSAGPQRQRVMSQPMLKIEQKLNQNKYNIQLRKCSQNCRIETHPYTPNRSKSPGSRYINNKKSMKSEQSEDKKYSKKQEPIAKLSTSALISYHKRLVQNAQKILYFQSYNKKK